MSASHRKCDTARVQVRAGHRATASDADIPIMSKQAAGWLVLALALAGCRLGNVGESAASRSDDGGRTMGSDSGDPAPDGGSMPDLAGSARADLAGLAGRDLSPTPDLAPPPTTAVLTYHNDNLRTGTQLRETTLTPLAVQTHGMTVAVSRPLDDASLSQVLYVPSYRFAAKTTAAFFATTINNTVYAYDANDLANTGTSDGLLWQTHFVDPASTTRTHPRGILDTPVIDLAAGELYVVYSTRDSKIEPTGESTVDVAFWLAALDLATGTIKRQVEVKGNVQRSDGTRVDFLPRNHWNRPGLLLANGVIYASFGARASENQTVYHGWVIGYDAKTFTLRGVFNDTPNSTQAGNGGGIWMGCAAPNADAAGNVYLITGNANRDPGSSWYGNSFIKLRQDASALTLTASFGPYDPQNRLQLNDVDLGAGGAVLLPGTRRIVGGGKTGIVYLLDSDTLDELQEFQGFINVYNPTFVVDSDWEGGPHLHGGPVVWQSADPDVFHFYAWSENDYLKLYQYDRAKDQLNPASPLVGSVLALQEIMPGGMLSLSADGHTAGTAILWASLPRDTDLDGRLFAFDAENLALLWQGDYPTVAKWMPPTIADGKVFVPTFARQVLVYMLGP
jgi:hypothetical protein